jgi:hypothetical protein
MRGLLLLGLLAGILLLTIASGKKETLVSSPCALKGIFQPFELGGETILIRSAVKH